MQQYLQKIVDLYVAYQVLLLQKAENLLQYEIALIENLYTLEADSVMSFEKVEKATFTDFEDKAALLIESYITTRGFKSSINETASLHAKSINYKNIESCIANWYTTFYAFYEDWRFKENIYILKHTLDQESSKIIVNYQHKIAEGIFPINNTNISYIKSFQANIAEMNLNDKDALRVFLSKELYKLQKRDTIKTGPQLDTLTEAIPNIFQRIEIFTTEKLNDLPAKVGVVRNPVYSKGVDKKEIRYFSPKTFIEFEILDDLKKQQALIKVKVELILREITQELKDFNQIIDYFLDIALSMFKDEHLEIDAIVQVVTEGLERAMGLSGNITTRCEQLSTKTSLEIQNNINKALNRIISLDDNDNILEINTRILTAKTLKETQNKKKLVAQYYHKVQGNVLKSLEDQSHWVGEHYQQIKQKLHLSSVPVSISSELSNYLIDTKQNIAKLPLIYQHLFEDAPIKEFNLFQERQKEMDVLAKAYKDWSEGRYGATLIIDENGSGKSSLLLNFKENGKFTYGNKLLQIHDFHYTIADYYKLVNNLFGTSDLNSDESINQYIKELPNKSILIIDGIERLFIKQMGGFECIEKLLSLIVATNNRFFWLCSVSRYSGNYLEKTISIQSYFDYLIAFDTLRQDDMKQIILKRHRLSGYSLEFLSNLANDSSKTIIRKDELEKRYFEALIDFAKTNISLSFSYWLESVEKISDNTVYIKQFTIPDFSFIESLEKDKKYCLLLIIMHGKITDKILSIVFNQPLQQTSRLLTIMKEDALLFKHGEYYFLNRMLYRHVVSYLLRTNLISA